MCGIAGVYPHSGGGDHQAVVVKMLESFRHRGPDGQGIWEEPSGGVVLGHQRLAIIDLSAAGHQPMLSENGRYAIVFNGEIYNYQELRRDLAAEGMTFQSQSDTEVVLMGYQRWGTHVLDRLVGMFAFAIWDSREQHLFLARDRAGEKPLYYAAAEDGFFFSSEVQAMSHAPSIDRRLDSDAVALYLQFQYIPAPYSIYRGVRKLPPAHACLVKGREVTVWRYWDPAPFLTAPRLNLPPEEAADQLDALLRQAVRGQMISDVPLGAFLSGGIDSTAVVSLMAELSSSSVKTFTIGFDVAGYNEAEHAAAVAKYLGTDHTVEYLTEREALALIPRIPEMYGEPFADSSALPTHLVSLVARKHVTVSLSGDGGDEAFGGYARYDQLERIYPWLQAARPMKGLLEMVAPLLPGRVARAIPLCGQPLEEVYRGIMSLHSGQDLHRMLGAAPRYAEYDRAWAASSGQPARRRAMLADMLTYMPEAILVKVDRAAMSASLETRAPLLDHRILEFSLKLPMRHVYGKALLKKLVYRKVPRTLLERPKQGFGVPMGKWFREQLRELLTDTLTSQRLKDVGIQDVTLVQRLVQEHLSGRMAHTARLWSLLVLLLWSERQNA